MEELSKFLRPMLLKGLPNDAALYFTVYLDAKIHRQLERIAKRKHTEVGDLVIQILKKDVELLEALS